MTDKAPNGKDLSRKHASQIVSSLLSQFYTSPPQDGALRSGGCGKGTQLCGISGRSLLAAPGQGPVTALLLNIPAIVGLVAYYTVAILMSLIATILTFKPTMIRFTVTEDGAGAAFASKTR